MLIDTPKGRGILIVDDDPDAISLLKILLTEAGYSKIIATMSGAEAISSLSAQGDSIYLVLLDLVMPDMDGLSFIKHLVNVHQFPVGIIIITAHASVEAVVGFFSAASATVIAMDFISKPFGRTELLQDVEKTLELIHSKRQIQVMNASNINLELMHNLKVAIDRIDNTVSQITTRVESIRRNQHGFLAQIGFELIKVIVIALAIIAILYLGIDRVLKDLLQGLP